MYRLESKINDTKIYFDQTIILNAFSPILNVNELKESFRHVPFDRYFEPGSRYRTTSRIKITDHGYELLPKKPLYQPAYVNALDSYGGIDREYEDIPASLLKTHAFDVMVKSWVETVDYPIEFFSVHQIRTTDSGNPTPEGRHRDGTDWTGVFVVNRHNIDDESGKTCYWDNNETELLQYVFPEGSLISHYDRYCTHCATPIIKKIINEPSFRDVFVLTTPEHGVNKEEEEDRRGIFKAAL